MTFAVKCCSIIYVNKQQTMKTKGDDSMTKKQIVFASTNQGKINELRKALPDYEVLSLSDFPNAVDVDEPFLTFVENAEHKARSFVA